MNLTELRKNYVSYVNIKYSSSQRTRTVYIARFDKFVQAHSRPYRTTKLEIQDYLSELNDSYYNQTLAALHIVYDKLLLQKYKLRNLSYRKSKASVHKVLSKEEVAQIIKTTKNEKHKMIITLLYTLGLRVAELQHLKLSDINRGTMQIRVRCGKGAKDRAIDMSLSLLIKIEAYYRNYRPNTYLIEGQRIGTMYSRSSIAKILSKHQSRIKKKITPHLLRHSIASHLINQGMNVIALSRFLGHSSVKSTERYYHYLKSDTLCLEQASFLDMAA